VEWGIAKISDRIANPSNLFYEDLPDEEEANLWVGRWRAEDRRIVAGTREPTGLGLKKNNPSPDFKQFEGLNLEPIFLIRTGTRPVALTVLPLGLCGGNSLYPT